MLGRDAEFSIGQGDERNESAHEVVEEIVQAFAASSPRRGSE